MNIGLQFKASELPISNQLVVKMLTCQKISEKIPADFNDKDWDYKVITEKLDTKLVKFFAPATEAISRCELWAGRG